MCLPVGWLACCEFVFIQPGKPTQNAYIERFNRQLGSELRKRVSTRFGDSQVYILGDQDKHRKVAAWKVVCGVCGEVRGP